MQTNTSLLESIGTLADNLGGPGFHGAMLEAFTNLIPGDEAQAYYYSSDGKAQCLHAIDTPEDDCAAYMQEFSSICPFFLHWRQDHRPGVKWLDQVTHGDKTNGVFERYFSEFYAPLGLNDEVGVFMPTPTRRTVGLFVQRNGQFDRTHLEDAFSAFPTLTRLHRANNRILLNSYSNPATDTVTSRPVRFVDRYGYSVFDNHAWRTSSVKTGKSFLAAISAMEENAASAFSIEGQGVLSRYGLEDDFPLAPGGSAYVFNEVPQSPSETDHDLSFLDGILSPREKDIVGQVLKGHPVKGIADTLGISTNTVKVHRQRIFEKLDITTERELFLLYIAHREAQWQGHH